MSKVKVYSSISSDSTGLVYLSCLVERETLLPYLEQLKTRLGDRFTSYFECKKQRDGDEFHITLINPFEIKDIKAGLDSTLEGKEFSIELVGLGSVSRNADEAFFVIVDSTDIQSFRSSVGLDKSDLHITLGFYKNDIHGARKDKSALI